MVNLEQVVWLKYLINKFYFQSHKGVNIVSNFPSSVVFVAGTKAGRLNKFGWQKSVGYLTRPNVYAYLSALSVSVIMLLY